MVYKEVRDLMYVPNQTSVSIIL